jgi:Holliday junction resolvase RusA-like endonuclease
MTYYFEVQGKQVAQQRPRFARVGQGVRTYDPQKSKDWKAYVRLFIAEEMKAMGWERVEGGLVVKIDFALQRPKSLPKKVTYHTKRPDLDNLAKAIKDAMTGIVYRDDSQIVSMTVSKHYGKPKTSIVIVPLDQFGG